MSTPSSRKPQAGQYGEMRKKITQVATSAIRAAAKSSNAAKAKPPKASKPKK